MLIPTFFGCYCKVPEIGICLIKGGLHYYLQNLIEPTYRHLVVFEEFVRERSLINVETEKIFHYPT